METKDISSAPLFIKDLFRAALLTRDKAYSPYSGLKVGAAIRTRSGQIFSGCNVENSSYGASMCAERVAIQKAISEIGGKGFEIEAVMVVTDATPPWPPCGMCRQVISEFGLHAKIYLANIQGVFLESDFGELFPQAFTPTHLQK